MHILSGPLAGHRGSGGFLLQGHISVGSFFKGFHGRKAAGCGCAAVTCITSRLSSRSSVTAEGSTSVITDEKRDRLLAPPMARCVTLAALCPAPPIVKSIRLYLKIEIRL